MASISRFRQLFEVKGKPAIIGMIHVLPLPGTPKYSNGSLGHVVSTACKEAEILAGEGVDGILIENMHDVPYLNRKVGPEITACMTAIAMSVRSVAAPIPCGLQILAGCNKQSLAVAKAAGLRFVRCEGFVFAHVADEGFMNADAGTLLRYRRSIDADDVLVLTDVKKKHSSHAITSDVNVLEVAKAAEYFLSDGVIVTGPSTGMEPDLEEVKTLKENINVSVIIGSGVTSTNVASYLNADGIVIGSHFKEDGVWSNSLSLERIQSFMTHFRTLSER